MGLFITPASFAEEDPLPREITPEEEAFLSEVLNVTPEQEARYNEVLKFWLHSIIGEEAQLSFSRLVNEDENGNRFIREDTFITFYISESIGQCAIIFSDEKDAMGMTVDRLVDESEHYPKVEMTAENIAERFDTIYKSHVHPDFFDEIAAKQRVVEYGSWYWDENDETIFQQFITLKSDETYGQLTYPAGTTIVFQLYSNRLSNTLPQISILWPTETE